MKQQPQQEEQSLDRAQVIRGLQSRTPAVQEEAERSLIAQDAAGLQTLLDIFSQEAKKRQSRLSLVGILGLIHLILTLAFFTYVFSTILRVELGGISSSRPEWLTSLFPVEGVFLVVSYALMRLLGHFAAPMTRLERRAAHAIAHFDDVRAVGPLMTAYMTGFFDNAFFVRLFSRRETQQQFLATRLKELLPRMKSGDVSLLSAQQRQGLYNAVILSEDAELVRAILKALEQIGDSRALPYVEKLATGKVRADDPGTRNARRQIRFLQWARRRRAGKADAQRIREAAQDCLPFLLDRAKAGEQTLLRAADPAAQPADTLLRSAAASSEPAQQELLRIPGTEMEENKPVDMPVFRIFIQYSVEVRERNIGN
ncbi:MAG TPA: hypothetical protein VKT32_01270 [Chthonomonadaceae bacterium]|nr:hypothetical protein [Chthonomonadaceae bacterium]